jgi:hypothetical protein
MRLGSLHRSQNATAVYAVSAISLQVPPVLIYTSRRSKEIILCGTPPGNDFRCHDESWMESEVFCEWKYLSCETDATREFATDFRWIQQSHSVLGCYRGSSRILGRHAVVVFPQYISNAVPRCQVFLAIEYLRDISERNEFEGESEAQIVDRTYCITGRHRVPWCCNVGNGYERVQKNYGL